MSRGLAVSKWQALKINGNYSQRHTRHGAGQAGNCRCISTQCGDGAEFRRQIL